jgi:hypothetical protein
VWALAGRLAARTRTVQLPLLGLSATLQQRWREDDIGDDECEIESHSTAAACWDGAVVLADLLCLPPPVLLLLLQHLLLPRQLHLLLHHLVQM